MLSDDFEKLVSVLKPVEGKKHEYYCPACGSENLKVSPRKNLWQTFGCSCTFNEVLSAAFPKTGENKIQPISSSKRSRQKTPRPLPLRTLVSEDHPCQVCKNNDTSCTYTQSDVWCAITTEASAEVSCPKGFVYFGDVDKRRVYVKSEVIADPQPEQAAVNAADLNEWKPEPTKRKTKVEPKDNDELAETLTAELNQRNTDFDISKLFHTKLCNQLEQVAQVFNQPRATVAAPLLAIAGSLLQVGTFLHLTNRSDHSQPPIVWVALVGESDDGKSPILKILSKPLIAMQCKAWEQYQQLREIWEQALAEWEGQPKKNRGPKPKSPAMRRFIFDNFTTESIGSSLQPFPEHGALVAVDELAAMILGFNQYRKTGNDRQTWLTLYDGGKIDVTRKTSDPLFVEKTCLPVVGGVQPPMLRDVMGKLEHQDGFWPRFFYARMVNSRMPSIDWDNDQDTGLNETLTNAYDRLEKQPATIYQLSPGAKSLWKTWHDETEDSRFQHDHPATKPLFRKARARAARIAVVAHCLNAAIDQQSPEQAISAQTLQGAIEFTRWGLNQILSLYSDFGISNSPEAARMARFITHFRDAGWINWKRVRAWWSAPEKPNQETCLHFMNIVVSQGHADSNGQSGGKLEIRIKGFSHKSQKTPNTPPDKDLNLVTNLVTVTRNLVTELSDGDGGDQSVTKNSVTVTKSVTSQNSYDSSISDNCDYVTRNLVTELSDGDGGDQSVTKNSVTVTKSVTSQNSYDSSISDNCDYVTRNLVTELSDGDGEDQMAIKNSSHLVTDNPVEFFLPGIGWRNGAKIIRQFQDEDDPKPDPINGGLTIHFVQVETAEGKLLLLPASQVRLCTDSQGNFYGF